MEEKLGTLSSKQLICLLLKLAFFFLLRGLTYPNSLLKNQIRKNLATSWSALNTCGLVHGSLSATEKYFSW
jgi:hypothetical protein